MGILTAASLAMALLFQDPVAAEPQWTPGTIVVEIDGAGAEGGRVFTDAVTRALSDASFTPLPLQSHSRYVAKVTVTRTARGFVPAEARTPPAMATLGQVFVPLPSGKSQVRGLVATDLVLEIRLRDGNVPAWSGRATTVQVEGAAADAPAAIAPKLAAALIRQFPHRSAEPVSVP